MVFVEIMGLRLGCYLLNISNTSQLLDLVAYSGYKFVGVITTISIAELVNGGQGTGGWVGWGVFIYTFLANSLFLVRGLASNVYVASLTGCHRCGHSSTFCYPRTRATVEVLCRPTPGRSGARGPSFSFSTRTASSCCSCGY